MKLQLAAATISLILILGIPASTFAGDSNIKPTDSLWLRSRAACEKILTSLMHINKTATEFNKQQQELLGYSAPMSPYEIRSKQRDFLAVYHQDDSDPEYEDPKLEKFVAVPQEASASLIKARVMIVNDENAVEATPIIAGEVPPEKVKSIIDLFRWRPEGGNHKKDKLQSFTLNGEVTSLTVSLEKTKFRVITTASSKAEIPLLLEGQPLVRRTNPIREPRVDTSGDSFFQNKRNGAFLKRNALRLAQEEYSTFVQIWEGDLETGEVHESKISFRLNDTVTCTTEIFTLSNGDSYILGFAPADKNLYFMRINKPKLQVERFKKLNDVTFKITGDPINPGDLEQETTVRLETDHTGDLIYLYEGGRIKNRYNLILSVPKDLKVKTHNFDDSMDLDVDPAEVKALATKHLIMKASF